MDLTQVGMARVRMRKYELKKGTGGPVHPYLSRGALGGKEDKWRRGRGRAGSRAGELKPRKLVGAKPNSAVGALVALLVYTSVVYKGAVCHTSSICE